MLWACSSYSSPVYTYGYTGNAAADSLRWQMGQVLEQVQGVDINGVIYQYTAVKNVQDDMVVNIGNTGAFNVSDDWSGRPGGTINRFIVLDNLPAVTLGDGYITVDGVGTLKDVSVVYTYRLDNNYIITDAVIPDLPAIEIYDVTKDQYVDDALKPTDIDLYADEEQKDEEEESDDRLEKGLAAANNSLTIANAVTQAAMLDAINRATNVDAYYAANIAGGKYQEVNQLIDSKLPENKRGLRNGFAQQVLHNKMVEMQYK